MFVRNVTRLTLVVLFTAGISLAQFTGTVWENIPNAGNAADPANMGATLASAQFVSTAIQFCSVPGGEPGCPATSAYTVGAFLNNPVFTNLMNGFDPTINLDNTEVQLTGSIFLTAGDNSFMTGHDDGFTLQISGGPGTTTCSTQSGVLCVNVPGATAFASTPFTINATVAGIYNFTLNYSECCGPPAYLLLAYANGAPVGSAQIFKSFGSASIPLGGTTSLSFTVLNPNAQGNLTSVGFSDTLPAGLAVAMPNGLTGSCSGGTITAVAGSSTVSLAGSTLAAGTSCTFSVNVIGTAAGTQNNSVTVTSNVGMGNTATASVNVVAGPVISKSFGTAFVALGSTTSLSFSISNPNSTATLTGIGFTDTLPAGLAVASPNGVSGSCGLGTITATPGTGTVSLSGAALSAGLGCTFSVSVTGTGLGLQTNSVTVASLNGGVGNTATASVTVLLPPVLSKVFGAVSIPPGGSTPLTFMLTNPNAAQALQNLSFSDTLPAGLLVATPSVITGACGGGTISATAGSNLITLSGANLAAQASCTFSVNVSATGSVTGAVTNTTSTVTSTQVPGPAASATVFIGEPFQVNYSANLNFGESYIDIGNAGTNGAPLLGPGFGAAVGNICVNVYAFDPSEELISCCSCLVTPGQTVNLGVNADLTSKTLTGVVPTSVTVKLLTTLAGGTGAGTTCNNAAATATGTLANGTTAFRTTLHATPVAGSYASTETPFTPSTLSAGELASITGRCASIIGNASGFGICTSCRAGALGGSKL